MYVYIYFQVILVTPLNRYSVMRESILLNLNYSSESLYLVQSLNCIVSNFCVSSILHFASNFL